MRLIPKRMSKTPLPARCIPAYLQTDSSPNAHPDALQQSFNLQADYFDGIDFGAMRDRGGKIDEKRQLFAWALLEATAKKVGGDFKRLNISGCQVVSEKPLIALLEQMPNIEQLVFSGLSRNSLAYVI